MVFGGAGSRNGYRWCLEGRAPGMGVGGVWRVGLQEWV